jgi:hypothetical protein
MLFGLHLCATGLLAQVTGDATGLQPTGVVCRNLTTGQRVLSTTTGPAWDCGALGLAVAPGDRVETGLRGAVPLQAGALAFDVRASSLPEDFASQLIVEDGTSPDFLLGDLDADGDLDVVGESGGFGDPRWYENLGGTVPAFVEHSFGGNSLNETQVIDANGDGRVDVVGTSLLDGVRHRLTLLRNVGGSPPTFLRRDIFADAAWNLTVGRSADVDDDGDLDFYALRREENCGFNCAAELVWLENVGTFPYVVHVIAEGKNGDVEAVDVDLDGDLDVAVGSGDLFSWWENESGTFAQEHVIPSSVVVFFLVSADLDSDGDTDLVGRAPAPDDVFGFWYENDGSGSFVEHLLHTFPSNPFTARTAVADFSGDGLLDVMFASESDPVWLENMGGSPLSFREHSLAGVFGGFNADGIGSIPGDLDDDGRPDFVADTLTLNWYRNQIGRRLVVGGMSVRGFLCRNRTTGQTVGTSTTDAAIDCESEGLTVNPGDEVEVFARGRAL